MSRYYAVVLAGINGSELWSKPHQCCPAGFYPSVFHACLFLYRVRCTERGIWGLDLLPKPLCYSCFSVDKNVCGALRLNLTHDAIIINCQ